MCYKKFYYLDVVIESRKGQELSGLGNSYHGYQKTNSNFNSYYGNQETCYREPYKNRIFQRKVKNMQAMNEELQKKEQWKTEEKQIAKKG